MVAHAIGATARCAAQADRAHPLRIRCPGLDAIAFDHIVTQSLYVADPDGNTVELYVDASDAWKTNPAIVASIGPLQL